jgi:hypothetical protein
VVLAGCGDKAKPAATATAAPTTATGQSTQAAPAPASSTATAPPATTSTGENPATATLTEPGGATTTSTSPEDQPGGAGDEESIRVPATFTFGASGVTPSSVHVPAFLAIELTVVSADGKAHAVTLESPGPVNLTAPAGGRASKRLAGLKAGTYKLSSLDGNGPDAELVVGGEPGP